MIVNQFGLIVAAESIFLEISIWSWISRIRQLNNLIETLKCNKHKGTAFLWHMPAVVLLIIFDPSKWMRLQFQSFLSFSSLCVVYLYCIIEFGFVIALALFYLLNVSVHKCVFVRIAQVYCMLCRCKSMCMRVCMLNSICMLLSAWTPD